MNCERFLMRKTSRFTLYKYCRTAAGWRSCKAVFSSNGKIKPDWVQVGSQKQKHPEGSYHLANKGQWIPVGVFRMHQVTMPRGLASCQRSEKQRGANCWSTLIVGRAGGINKDKLWCVCLGAGVFFSTSPLIASAKPGQQNRTRLVLLSKR